MNLTAKNLKGSTIYMIGIKGTGMTALVEILVSRGATVIGSDVDDEFYTDKILKALEVKVCTPFSVQNIPNKVDLVIFSGAYSVDNNVEMAEVSKRQLPMMSYTKALGSLSQAGYSCGVAGVHGKTTTTAMVGVILKELKLDATVLTGSVVTNFNNSCTMINGEKYFVAETCEYKRNFLDFFPRRIILTSVESDHEDYYPTYEEILSAFLQYIDRLPQFGEVFYCADNSGARDAANLAFSSRPDIVFTSYGEKATGEFKINYKGIKDGRQYFSLAGFAGEFSIQLPGRHNVLNATAAIALAISLLKVEKQELTIHDIASIRKGLASFSGLKRRSEIVGTANNILIMDDYAHHPTAIKSTLAGLRAFYPNRRIVVDFMSHTYSRTHALLEDFAKAFSDADIVILHKIYASAREKYDGNTTGQTLFEHTKKYHKKVYYYEEIMEAEEFVMSTLKNGDLFITMGAGDNWKLGKAVYERLNKKETN